MQFDFMRRASRLSIRAQLLRAASASSLLLASTSTPTIAADFLYRMQPDEFNGLTLNGQIGNIVNFGRWSSIIKLNKANVTNHGTWDGAVQDNRGTIENNGIWNATQFVQYEGLLTGKGTLQGDATGSSGSTADVIIHGGIFRPGETPNTFMTITGQLTLNAGATYQITLSEAASTYAKVSGVVRINNAKLTGNLIQGRNYIVKDYVILSGREIQGRFDFNEGDLTGLPAQMSASLDYTSGTQVTLKLLSRLGGGLDPAPAPTALSVNAGEVLQMDQTRAAFSSITLRGGEIAQGSIIAPIWSDGGTITSINMKPALTVRSGKTLVRGNTRLGAVAVAGGELTLDTDTLLTDAISLQAASQLKITGSNGKSWFRSNITNGGTITFDVTADHIYEGQISGGGQIVIKTTADSKVIFLNSQTLHTGTTTVLPGSTLQYGNSSAVAALPGRGTLANGGNVVFSFTSGSVTYSGVISNYSIVEDRVTKTTPGTVYINVGSEFTLTKQQLYTGDTIVLSGILVLTSTGRLDRRSRLYLKGGGAELELSNTVQTIDQIDIEGRAIIKNGTINGTISSKGGQFLALNVNGAVVVNSGWNNLDGSNMNNVEIRKEAYVETNRSNLTINLNEGTLVSQTATTIRVMRNTGAITNDARSNWIGDILQNEGTISNLGTWSGNITMRSGLLTGTGSYEGNVTLTGGTFQVSQTKPASQISIKGNLTLNADSNFYITLSPTQATRVNVDGIATLNGAKIIGYALQAGAPYITKDYIILTSTNNIIGLFAPAIDLKNLPNGIIPSLDYSNPKAVILRLTATLADEGLTKVVTGAWDLAGENHYYKSITLNGGSIFEGSLTSGGQPLISLGGTIYRVGGQWNLIAQSGTTEITVPDQYKGTPDPTVTTGFIIIKDGATLKLVRATTSVANDLTIEKGGTLIYGEGYISVKGKFQNDGTIILDRNTDDGSILSDVTGSGNLIKRGTGNTTIQANYTTTGEILVEKGTLSLMGYYNTQASRITLQNGTTLDALNTTLSGEVVINNATLKNGSAILGKINMNGGTLSDIIANSAEASGVIDVLSGNNTFTNQILAKTINVADGAILFIREGVTGNINNASDLIVAGTVVGDIVQSGGSLRGVWNANNVTIKSGIVTPGNVSAENYLNTVRGALTLSNTTTYRVTIGTDFNTGITANGVVTLNNATLQATFKAPTGSEYYIPRSYDLITGSNIVGRFAATTARNFANLPAGFAATLEYTAKKVSLKLEACLVCLPDSGVKIVDGEWDLLGRIESYTTVTLNPGAYVHGGTLLNKSGVTQINMTSAKLGDIGGTPDVKINALDGADATRLTNSIFTGDNVLRTVDLAANSKLTITDGNVSASNINVVADSELQIGVSGSSVSSLKSDLSLLGKATFVLGNSDLVYSNLITGTGLVEVATNKRLTISSVNSNFTGEIRVTKGTLALTKNFSFHRSATISVGANGILDLSRSSQTGRKFELRGGVLRNGFLVTTASNLGPIASLVTSYGGQIEDISGDMATLPDLIAAGGTTTLTNYINLRSITINADATVFVTDTTANATTIKILPGGVLHLGGGGDLKGAITNGGTVRFTPTSTFRFATVIANDGANRGGVEKTGTSKLIFTSAQTYTGETIISQGDVGFEDAGRLSSQSLVTIKQAGTLDLSAKTDPVGNINLDGGSLRNGVLNGSIQSTGGIIQSITGSARVTLMSGQTDLAENQTFQSLNVTGTSVLAATDQSTTTVKGPVTFSSSSTFNVEITPSSSSLLAVDGAVTLNNATLKVSAIGRDYTFISRDYTIITSKTGINGTFNNNVQLVGLTNFAASSRVDGNNVILTLTSSLGTPTLVDWVIREGEVKDLAGSTNAQFATAMVAGGTLRNGRAVSRDGNAIHSRGGFIADISGNANLALDDVSSSETTLVSGTNSFGTIFVGKNAVLTVINQTTATATTISAEGTLKLGDGTTNGELSGSITTAGEVILTRTGRPDAYTLARSIAGTGNFSLKTADTINITAAQTYTGSTTILGGTVILAGANILGNSSNVIIKTGGILSLGGQAQVIQKLTLDGGKITTGTLARSTQIFSNGGTIEDVSVAANVPNPDLTLQAGTTTLVATKVRSMTFDTVTGVDGTLLTISGNPIPGDTNEVRIQHLSVAPLAEVTVQSQAQLYIGNGELDTVMEGNIRVDGSLIFDRASTYTYSSLFKGSGNIYILKGRLILTAFNTFTGIYNVRSGAELEIKTDGGIVRGGAFLEGDLIFSPATSANWYGNANGSGRIFIRSGTVRFDVKVATDGGLFISRDASFETLTTTEFGGYSKASAPVRNDGSLSVHSIWNATLTNTGSTTVWEDGIWTGNAINSGTLTIKGPWTGDISNTGSVDLFNVLKGNFTQEAGSTSVAGGSFIGSVSIKSGTFKPGADNPSQKTSVQGNLTFNAQAIYSITLNNFESSSTSVTQTASLNGAKVVVNALDPAGNGAYVDNKTYVILSANVLIGTFDANVTLNNLPNFRPSFHIKTAKRSSSLLNRLSCPLRIWTGTSRPAM